MRKPIVFAIVCHLPLFRAIHLHAPNLHQTATNGIKPDIVSARRKLWSVIQTGSIGQLFLNATLSRNSIDIILTVTLGTISQQGAIGRPTMQVAWSYRRNKRRRSSRDRQRIDARFAILSCMMTHSHILTI